MRRHLLHGFSFEKHMIGIPVCNNHSKSSKVLDFRVIWKSLCDFLLVINSNIGPVYDRFGDVTSYRLKIANFPYPTPFAIPPPAGQNGFVTYGAVEPWLVVGVCRLLLLLSLASARSVPVKVRRLHGSCGRRQDCGGSRRYDGRIRRRELCVVGAGCGCGGG